MSDFSADVTLSSTRFSLTEPLNIKLTLTYPKNYKPELHEIRSHLARQFTLLSEEISPPIAKNDHLTQDFKWQVEANTPGKKMVTFYNIPFLSKEGTVELISDLYPIEVTLPKVDLTYEGELAPLMTFDKTLPLAISRENQLMETPDRHVEKIEAKTVSYKELFGLTLPLILSLLTFYYFTRASTRQKLIALTKRDAKETALNSLGEIESRPLPENYHKMSAIVRHFIEEQYRLNASAATSQECLQKLSHQHIRKETQEELQVFFRESDQVKYAHHKPSPEELNVTIASAKRFITGS